ncbi:MAG: Flp1 family type IVb pilin [Herbinix sp.]|nr:Flp1 family type IVb pilin [Herbinix sp.]
MVRVMERIKVRIKRFYWKMTTTQLEGIGVIEIILILVIIIGLVLIFRNQIADIMQNAFDSINGDAGDINADIVIEKKTSS